MVIGRPRVLVSLPLSFLLVIAAPASLGAAPAPDEAPAPKPSEPQWKVDLRREGLYREGQGLIQQGRYQEALDKLREVNQIRSHPRVLLWIGHAEEQLGQLLKAKATYEKARQDAQAAKLKPEEQDAERAFSAITPKIPRIIVRLSESDGAEISLDSTQVPFQKEGWEVDPGKHAVSVTWPGLPPFQTDVIAKAGAIRTIDVPAPEKPAAKVVTAPRPRVVPKKESGGPPGEVIGLWVSGGLAVAGGATLLGVGVSTDNGGMTRGGVAVMILGLGLAVGGLVWQVTTIPGEAEVDPEARARSNIARGRALSPSIHVQIAPSPAGLWGGVGGRF